LLNWCKHKINSYVGVFKFSLDVFAKNDMFTAPYIETRDPARLHDIVSSSGSSFSIGLEDWDSIPSRGRDFCFSLQWL